MSIPVDVQSILDPDESIDYQCSDSQKARVASNLISKFVMSSALVIGYIGSSVIDWQALPLTIGNEYLQIGGIATAAYLGVVGLQTAKGFRTNYTYYVTDDKVITFTDAPAETTASYVEIETIQTLTITRDRFEQFFDAATVAISTERGYSDTSLRAVEPGAETELVEEIRQRMET